MKRILHIMLVLLCCMIGAYQANSSPLNHVGKEVYLPDVQNKKKLAKSTLYESRIPDKDEKLKEDKRPAKKNNWLTKIIEKKITKRINKSVEKQKKTGAFRDLHKMLKLSIIAFAGACLLYLIATIFTSTVIYNVFSILSLAAILTSLVLLLIYIFDVVDWENVL